MAKTFKDFVYELDTVWGEFRKLGRLEVLNAENLLDKYDIITEEYEACRAKAYDRLSKLEDAIKELCEENERLTR